MLGQNSIPDNGASNTLEQNVCILSRIPAISSESVGRSRRSILNSNLEPLHSQPGPTIRGTINHINCTRHGSGPAHEASRA